MGSAPRHLARDWFYSTLSQLVTPQEAASSGQPDTNRMDIDGYGHVDTILIYYYYVGDHSCHLGVS